MPNALVLRNDAKQTRSAFIFCVLPLRPAHSQAPQCSSRKHSWPQMELVWSFLEALHDQRRRVSGRGARESICSAWLWERCSVTQVCTVCTRASWAHAAKNTKNIRYTFSVDGFSPFFFGSFFCLYTKLPPRYVFVCTSLHFMCSWVKVKKELFTCSGWHAIVYFEYKRKGSVCSTLTGAR